MHSSENPNTEEQEGWSTFLLEEEVSTSIQSQREDDNNNNNKGLPSKLLLPRFEHPSKFDGISPSNSFTDKASTSTSDSREHMSIGRLPDKLLFVRTIRCNEEILNKLGGTGPVSWFVPKLNHCSLLRLPISSGILPCRKLNPNTTVSRFVMLISVGGIGPENLLYARNKC